MRPLLIRICAGCALAGIALAVPAQSNARSSNGRYTTWTSYLGGADSAQFTALHQINTSNVSTLEVAWRFPAGKRTFLFNPLIADGLAFVLAGANDLVALDAATGAAVWTRPHPGAVGTRGINYWRSADGRDRRLIYIADGYLTAVDARTGQTVSTFGRDGRVDLRTGLAANGPVDRRPQPAPDQQSRPRLREPDHREPAGIAPGIRLQPRRRAGVRRALGRPALGLPLAPRRRRDGRRHVAERRARQRTAASTTGAS